MTDSEKEQSRDALNTDLKRTLDKEQLRDLDAKRDDEDKVRGGACDTGSCPGSR